MTQVSLKAKRMDTKTRVRRKDSRPEEIVTCAMKLFIEKGYFETNFQDIANAGHMARSTIYLYFKDKKEILKAALNKKFEENKNALIIMPADKNDNFHERLTKLLTRMQKIVNDDFFKHFLTMMAEISVKDPEIARIWKEEIFDKLKAIWMSMCAEFKLDENYREYVFNTLYSVFLMSCISSVCFGKENPFIDFVNFSEITVQDIQKGKFDWMLNHE